MLDIYQVLSAKSLNDHMIRRYIKFIDGCRQVNNSLSKIDYVELHHVCPKAYDLFYEYADLKIFPENGVYLTFRQHLIAHVMLWKIFGKSQAVALDCMLGKFNSDTNSGLYNRKVPHSIKIRYLEKVKLDAIASNALKRKGFSTYKDSNGEKYFLHEDDPLITELGLVGNNKGHFHTEEAKQAMSAAKQPNKTVKLYFLNCKTTVKLFSPEFSEYLAQGWSTTMSPEDHEYSQKFGHSIISSKLKGTANYMYPDTGEHAGRLAHDDPSIQALGLVPLITDNHRAQWITRTQKATEAKLGTTTYNNGRVEAKFREDPGPGWVKGRLPRTEAHLTNQRAGIMKANKDVSYWNNGIICQKFPKGFKPGPEWTPGMLPRKKAAA